MLPLSTFCGAWACWQTFSYVSAAATGCRGTGGGRSAVGATPGGGAVGGSRRRPDQLADFRAGVWLDSAWGLFGVCSKAVGVACSASTFTAAGMHGLRHHLANLAACTNLANPVQEEIENVEARLNALHGALKEAQAQLADAAAAAQAHQRARAAAERAAEAAADAAGRQQREGEQRVQRAEAAASAAAVQVRGGGGCALVLVLVLVLPLLLAQVLHQLPAPTCISLPALPCLHLFRPPQSGLADHACPRCSAKGRWLDSATRWPAADLLSVSLHAVLLTVV